MKGASSSGQQIVSKSKFAQICQVTPTRVGQWLKEGKITGDAIVGTGRNARIDLVKARAQLGARRDPGQALGNGKKTRLDDTAAASEAHILKRLSFALDCERRLRASDAGEGAGPQPLPPGLSKTEATALRRLVRHELAGGAS